MKVRDKALGKFVDVSEKACVADKRRCYWPRIDPGVFTPGQGYKARGSKPSNEYICGTRAIRGCPDEFC